MYKIWIIIWMCKMHAGMAPCGRYGDAAVNREDDYTSIEILYVATEV